MKRSTLYVIFLVLGSLGFGVLNTLAREQSQWRWRLILGVVSGVVAGLATLFLVRFMRQSPAEVRMPDDNPRFRWWYYVGGMILAGDFGALLVVGDALTNEGARSIAVMSAGVIEAFAFMSLTKAVRSGDDARQHRDSTDGRVAP